MIEILGKESMIVQLKNKEQLYEERFIVRNVKLFWEEELYILGRELFIFEENMDLKEK